MVAQYLTYNTNSFRHKLVLESKKWLGTPYCHQASVCKVGADCLGLVRGVWRSVYGFEPEQIPSYTEDWSEVEGEERLYSAALRHLVPLSDNSMMMPGDILLFRMRRESVAKHLGILVNNARFIHSYSRRGVVSSSLEGYWMSKLWQVFRFPELLIAK